VIFLCGGVIFCVVGCGAHAKQKMSGLGFFENRHKSRMQTVLIIGSPGFTRRLVNIFICRATGVDLGADSLLNVANVVVEEEESIGDPDISLYAPGGEHVGTHELLSDDLYPYSFTTKKQARGTTKIRLSRHVNHENDWNVRFHEVSEHIAGDRMEELIAAADKVVVAFAQWDTGFRVPAHCTKPVIYVNEWTPFGKPIEIPGKLTLHTSSFFGGVRMDEVDELRAWLQKKD
jgi:hypothetical protein